MRFSELFPFSLRDLKTTILILAVAVAFCILLQRMDPSAGFAMPVFVLTVLLTALALALLNPMLAWINVTPDNGEVYRAAFTYCAIIFAGIGAQLFYNFICSFLRSMGDSVTPLLFLLFSTVLNVGLDLLFIIVFHWGVAGAAVATVSAQLISTVACFVYAFAHYPDIRLQRKDWRITW